MTYIFGIFVHLLSGAGRGRGDGQAVRLPGGGGGHVHVSALRRRFACVVGLNLYVNRLIASF